MQTTVLMLWLVLDIKSTWSGPEHHGLVLNTCFCLHKPLSQTSAGFKLTNVDVLSRIFITSLAARSLLHIKEYKSLINLNQQQREICTMMIIQVTLKQQRQRR